MILVDTSVWVAHFRTGEPRLVNALEEMQVLTHSFVIGELALGRLERRGEILDLLGNSPAAEVATHGEVLSLIDQHDLSGSGIGWVDAHLLAAALLSSASLWTLDRSLAIASKRLNLTP